MLKKQESRAKLLSVSKGSCLSFSPRLSRKTDGLGGTKNTAYLFRDIPYFYRTVFKSSTLYRDLLLFANFVLDNLPSHDNAHDRGHHEASRPAAGVTEAMETADRGVEVFVHLDAVAVELQLGGVKQIGRAHV